MGRGRRQWIKTTQKNRLQKVYGLDINEAYLKECRKRFPYLEDKLELHKVDMTDPDAAIPESEEVIADLFIEYIGVEHFVLQVTKCRPFYVSCVIQQNSGNGFVSASPYERSFSEIAGIHKDIQPRQLVDAMQEAAYLLSSRMEYPLPDGKSLIRLAFLKT